MNYESLVLESLYRKAYTGTKILLVIAAPLSLLNILYIFIYLLLLTTFESIIITVKILQIYNRHERLRADTLTSVRHFV